MGLPRTATADLGVEARGDSAEAALKVATQPAWWPIAMRGLMRRHGSE